MSIVLIGYRGSGKTTVGRRLADQMWLPFLDSDELIVKRAGKSIKDIFAEGGEAEFRDIESAVVQDVCAMNDHVISLGGGAILREENRQAIRSNNNRVVYLRCEAEVLYQRINADPTTTASRPNLTAAGGVDEVKQLLVIREPLYRQAMTAELDVTNLSAQEAVQRVVRLI
ncbi:MAG TPA: shikimate kinase [Tepidisphaeraceae bacterium]|jgi:shikimate kinase|nr:shikimate kinase [Tepidisphaeraceae bacterium]